MVKYEQKNIEPIKINQLKDFINFSYLLKRKTLMNFEEFSFVLVCLLTFKEFNKLNLININKYNKNIHE